MNTPTKITLTALISATIFFTFEIVRHVNAQFASTEKGINLSDAAIAKEKRPCANLTSSEGSRLNDIAIAQARADYNMTFASVIHHLIHLCLQFKANQTALNVTK
jgi:hypothetical protein